MIDDSNLDDFGISRRILEQRRTGIVSPLDRIGLDHIVETAPMGLAVMGIDVTPEAIVQRVRAELERGVEQRIYGWPARLDFSASTSGERLEALCDAFAFNYGNGAAFRDRMSKAETKELLRSYDANMFGSPGDALPEAPTARLN